MFNIIGQYYPELPLKKSVKPSKCNIHWGNDYIFMDSNTFMGGSGGLGYEKIINMCKNIWDAHSSEIISNVRA